MTFRVGDHVRIKDTLFSAPGFRDLNGATGTVVEVGTRPASDLPFVNIALDKPVTTPITNSNGRVKIHPDNIQHVTETDRKDTVDSIPRLSTLPPSGQIARVLEATKGTCIKSDLIQRFLTASANSKWASKTSAEVAREIEQFIHSAGRNAGYPTEEIDDFLAKIGVPARPKTKKIRVVLDVEVAATSGTFPSSAELAQWVRDRTQNVSGVVGVTTHDFYTL